MSSSNLPDVLPMVKAEEPITVKVITIAITTKEMCELYAGENLEYQLPGQPRIVVSYARD